MKIVVIGATGTIGQAVVETLSVSHEILQVGKTRGSYQVDITSSDSIRSLFTAIGKVDAIVAATGNLHFGPLTSTTADQFKIGLHDKLLGQVDLALIGLHFLNDGGSITLTSGIVSEEPIRGGSNATTVNAAIDGFIRAAAIELPRGLRINSVNPTVVQESMEVYGAFFPGYEPVPVRRVANAYRKSIEGPHTGRVYRVW